MSILTEADKEAILIEHKDRSNKLQGLFLNKYEDEVKDFTYGCPSQMVQWSNQVLNYLSEDIFDARERDARPIQTMNGLKEAWAKSRDDAMRVHQEEMRGPDFAAYLHRNNQSLSEHPWGDKLVAQCNLWLEATPYEVFRFASDYRKGLTEYVKDAALDILDDRVTVDVSQVARILFEDMIRDLESHLDAKLAQKGDS